MISTRPGGKSSFQSSALSATRLILRPANFEANAQDVSVLKDFVAAQAPRYPELAMPVVAITGDTDTVVSPVIHSTAIARDAKNGRLVTIQGAGHMPHLTDPQSYCTIVQSFASTAQALHVAGSR